MTTQTPPPRILIADRHADRASIVRRRPPCPSRDLDDIVAPGSGALARVDAGRLAVFALRPAAGIPPAAPGRSDARLAALHRRLLSLPASAQLIMDCSPPDAAAYRHRHAEATAAEPLPRLRALGHTLRAWLGDALAAVPAAGPRLWLIIGQPPAPAALLDDLAASLAHAGLTADPVIGADLLALLSAMTTRRSPGDPLPPGLAAGPEGRSHRR